MCSLMINIFTLIQRSYRNGESLNQILCWKYNILYVYKFVCVYISVVLLNNAAVENILSQEFRGLVHAAREGGGRCMPSICSKC